MDQAGYKVRRLQMNSCGVRPLRVWSYDRSYWRDEVLEVSAQPVVIVVVEAFDGGILDGAVHAL